MYFEVAKVYGQTSRDMRRLGTLPVVRSTGLYLLLMALQTLSLGHRCTLYMVKASPASQFFVHLAQGPSSYVKCSSTWIQTPIHTTGCGAVSTHLSLYVSLAADILLFSEPLAFMQVQPAVFWRRWRHGSPGTSEQEHQRLVCWVRSRFCVWGDE